MMRVAFASKYAPTALEARCRRLMQIRLQIRCASCSSRGTALGRRQTAVIQGSLELQVGMRRESAVIHEALSQALPGELCGAATVLSAAARGASRPLTTTSFAAATADFQLGGEGADEQKESLGLRERLDFKPKLSVLDNVASFVIPAIICCILYWVTRPSQISVLYAVGMAMIAAAWVAICRAVLLERHYTARLVPEASLGDATSRFARVEDVTVHYKCAKPASGRLRAAIHCFHGFGANTGSWEAVLRKLAHSASAQVTAHDMPGFGLTERPTEANHYSLDYNAKLGQGIVDKELLQPSDSAASQDAGSEATLSSISNVTLEFEPKQQAEEAKGAGSTHRTAERRQEDGRVPKILMGHSLGGACAAAQAIQDPEAVSALIFVAPAVMAYSFLQPAGRGLSGEAQTDGIGRTAAARFHDPEQPLVKSLRRQRKNVLLRLALVLAQAFSALASGLVTTLLQPVTVVSLRSAVRSRAFWERGLARAWYDKATLTPEVVDAYRLPQLVKGWEKGLVRFAGARMSGGRSLMQVLKDAWKGRIQPTQAERLAEAVANHNIKVLIVHGENDSLVPASNSLRLAALLPNTRLVRMQQTGHVPHEERPDDFVRIVRQFLEDSRI